jgi:hypothetical protein
MSDKKELIHNTHTKFIYHKEHEYQKKIKPYKVSNSRKTADEIFELENLGCNQAYGNNINLNFNFERITSEPLIRFQNLLKSLLDCKNVKFMTHLDTLSSNNDPFKILILRHDIDSDFQTSLEIAKIEYDLNIQASFYILHTNQSYYGEGLSGPSANKFRRHKSLLKYYKQIQDYGHEIGLHIDPYTLYQDFSIDGSQALVEELNWLRENGIKISGTAEHNNTAQHGASNASIFENKFLATDEDFHKKNGIPMSFIHREKWAPIGTLSQNLLNLKYEARDLYDQKDINVRYFGLQDQCSWVYKNFHNTDSNCAVTKNGSILQEEIPAIIEEANKEILVKEYYLFSIHPNYYGLRDDANKLINLNSTKDNVSQINQSIFSIRNNSKEKDHLYFYKNKWGFFSSSVEAYLNTKKKILYVTQNLNENRHLQLNGNIAARLAKIITKSAPKEQFDHRAWSTFNDKISDFYWTEIDFLNPNFSKYLGLKKPDLLVIDFINIINSADDKIGNLFKEIDNINCSVFIIIHSVDDLNKLEKFLNEKLKEKYIIINIKEETECEKFYSDQDKYLNYIGANKIAKKIVKKYFKSTLGSLRVCQICSSYYFDFNDIYYKCPVCLDTGTYKRVADWLVQFKSKLTDHQISDFCNVDIENLRSFSSLKPIRPIGQKEKKLNLLSEEQLEICSNDHSKKLIPLQGPVKELYFLE